MRRPPCSAGSGDYHFDFRTDAALICTDLVYKAYEPAPGFAGLRLDVPILLGRPVMPANEFARQFDAAFGSPEQQLDLVLFFEGQERARQAVERGVDAFRQSWRRPKWQLPKEAATGGPRWVGQRW